MTTLNNVNVVVSIFMIQLDFDHQLTTLILVQDVEVKVSYNRETEQAKIKCPVLRG